jgi:hypothetical protein
LGAGKNMARFSVSAGGAEIAVGVAMGREVITSPPPSARACSKIHTIIAVIEHAPMEVGTE